MLYNRLIGIVGPEGCIFRRSKPNYAKISTEDNLHRSHSLVNHPSFINVLSKGMKNVSYHLVKFCINSDNFIG